MQCCFSRAAHVCIYVLLMVACHILAFLQSTKLKEQERTIKTLQKEKQQLQSEVRDLKARIKEGECHATHSCCPTPGAVAMQACSPAGMSSCCAVQICQCLGVRHWWFLQA
jgi:predicted aldo/keto reductase-like oxidoreductase